MLASCDSTDENGVVLSRIGASGVQAMGERFDDQDHDRHAEEEGWTVLREFEAALRRGETPGVEEWLGRAAETDRQELREKLEALLRQPPPQSNVPEELWPTEDVPAPESTVESSGTPLPFLQPGDKVGKYIVEERVGVGAFGTVYRAEDPVLKRKVAVKVPLRDRILTGDRLELFLREAQAIAQLDHPAIVPVYDHGLLDGTSGFYLVLKYVDGPSLADFLKSERPGWQRSAEIMLCVCEAMAVVHSAGYRHRDLKPANILLDGHGQPHVTDFGLALHEDLQQPGCREWAGTLPYMSPEQVRGEADRLDGRSDIWALGVILYEMVTGQLPFQTKSEILERDPVPVSQRTPEIPVQLDEICQRCLGARSITVIHRPRLSPAICAVPGMALRAPLQMAVLNDHCIQIANLTIVSAGVACELPLAEAVKPSHERLGPNPYRGLGAFREQDADLFFGREAQVDRLYDKLGSLYSAKDEKIPRILPILGPSGCGKSSLARAGLIAELARRPLAGWRTTRAAVFTPGSRPLESLANVLRSWRQMSPLRSPKRGVPENPARAGRLRPHGWSAKDVSVLPGIESSPLVLFVDQFEEVYTQCEDEDERFSIHRQSVARRV